MAAHYNRPEQNFQLPPTTLVSSSRREEENIENLMTTQLRYRDLGSDHIKLSTVTRVEVVVSE